jgi:hypothetical protein
MKNGGSKCKCKKNKEEEEEEEQADYENATLLRELPIARLSVREKTRRIKWMANWKTSQFQK